jgi:hypothetical protein
VAEQKCIQSYGEEIRRKDKIYSSRRWDAVKTTLQDIGSECINLALDRNKWRTVVNMAMNHRFPLKKWGIS